MQEHQLGIAQIVPFKFFGEIQGLVPFLCFS